MANDIPGVVKVVTVESQVRIIKRIAYAEFFVSVIILLCQTIAIAASYEFSTRSLTGIWTSYFFFMAAGLALFWSARCTFNGLLGVLVFQIIAATTTVPLFCACCILLGVYPFVFDPDEYGGALVGSSITIFCSNIVIIVSCIAELALNSYNAYKCYFLAYGGQPKKQNNYDPRGSIDSSSESVEGEVVGEYEANISNVQDERKSSDASMPQNPDLVLSSSDILIIRHCGVVGIILALIIFGAQTTMLLTTDNDGIRIGSGIWGGLYYFVSGVMTFCMGWKPSSQSHIVIFSLQLVQLILSIPVICVSYYVTASFGSCLQHLPFTGCSYNKAYGFGTVDLLVTLLGAVIAFCGIAQSLVSVMLVLICAQAVCGFRCMITGATVVYPM